MADPLEDTGDAIRKIRGYEPKNCEKIQEPIKEPTLDAAVKAAKAFIKQDKKHNCCNVTPGSQGQGYFVQRWRRPVDQLEVVLVKAASSDTTFYCHVKLPIIFDLIAEED